MAAAVVIPGRRGAASPESITTTASMESGLAPKGAPRNDEGDWRHTSAFPRHIRARVLRIVSPSNRRGRRECRMQAAPASLACKERCTLRTQATTGQPDSRHSLRDGVTAYTRPPRCPGLIATVAGGIIRQLDPSVGRSGPRDFAVRLRRVRLTRHKRPSHPRPTVRDDRPKRPSSSRRDARECRGDLPDGASEKICGRLARRAIWAQC